MEVELEKLDKNIQKTRDVLSIVERQEHVWSDQLSVLQQTKKNVIELFEHVFQTAKTFDTFLHFGLFRFHFCFLNMIGTRLCFICTAILSHKNCIESTFLRGLNAIFSSHFPNV